MRDYYKTRVWALKLNRLNDIYTVTHFSPLYIPSEIIQFFNFFLLKQVRLQQYN